MRRRRREFEVFSMSFLDCICCGFGAMILLLVLTQVRQPIVLEKTEQNLGGQVEKLEQALYEIRGETRILNRELKGRIEQTSDEKSRLARLGGDLTDIQGRYNASQKDAEFNNQLQQQLVATYQRLNEDQRRMLANYRRPSTAPMAGIPADSEYVVFVIDTSGSMQENHWEDMKQHMQQILDLYPKLKGLQVMDDEGVYLFPSTAARWMSDNPARRKVIMDSLEHWVTYSNSSPTEGIVRALDDFWSRDHRVSIYYLGDDFTGPSIQDALDQVTRLNKDRRVRIHALGFPMPPDQPQETARRYAELMRLMCEQNGGAFVGLPASKGHRRLPPLVLPVG
ncbi:MAG: VWA domain-containing protein [Proteobacteria bacterium]|nr:VWA domain-containing protein [Pseudomonadota bacterium]